ncbi:MAG: S8 family serine peptidase [Flavobacteriales bacterium]|nr:MAG: S8 family serine peptidase [Flavobacteriales bacterium]
MFRLKLPALVLPALCAIGALAQTGPATYWVQFTDKTSTPYTLSAPEEFLSARSLDRRQQQGIALDESDLPVDPAYVSALLAAGDFELVNVSKWFNAVTIRSTDTLALDTIGSLPFVQQMRQSRPAGPDPIASVGTVKYASFLKQEVGDEYATRYGASFRQIEMMNGHLLHDAGAEGQGLLIGVLDSGFDQADSLHTFKELRERGGIVLTRDMAYQDGDVYSDNYHGRSVLSVMAGHWPGRLLGTAPGADYVLLRTEVAESEYLWEEDNWIAGAELCDSIGCDVLSTSLGYTQFDDSLTDHTYTDMDGRSTRISIAATMAARKGMIPVNSAGNSGHDDWRFIGAPADADSILAVGAVGNDRIIAGYSSYGPSFDGRVKPDVAATGYATIGLGVSGTQVQPINGTSFSGPLVAGLVACLWQLHPDRSGQEIVQAVRRSASQYDSPDDRKGYGIPDFYRAHLLLGGTDRTGLESNIVFGTWPSPFIDVFHVELFTGAATQLDLVLYDTMGRVAWRATDFLEPDTYKIVRVGDATLRSLPAGAYVLDLWLGAINQRSVVVKE